MNQQIMLTQENEWSEKMVRDAKWSEQEICLLKFATNNIAQNSGFRASQFLEAYPFLRTKVTAALNISFAIETLMCKLLQGFHGYDSIQIPVLISSISSIGQDSLFSICINERIFDAVKSFTASVDCSSLANFCGRVDYKSEVMISEPVVDNASQRFNSHYYNCAGEIVSVFLKIAQDTRSNNDLSAELKQYILKHIVSYSKYFMPLCIETELPLELFLNVVTSYLRSCHDIFLDAFESVNGKKPADNDYYSEIILGEMKYLTDCLVMAFILKDPLFSISSPYAMQLTYHAKCYIGRMNLI